MFQTYQRIADKSYFRVTAHFKEPVEMFELQSTKGFKTMAFAEDFHKSFRKVADDKSLPVNYLAELKLLMDAVLERLGKINNAKRYLEAKKATVGKSPEAEKLEPQIDQYEVDLKYYQKILEDIQKEISDFQSIQSQVQIQREVTIKDLYNKLGIDQKKFDEHKESSVDFGMGETKVEETEETTETSEKPKEKEPQSFSSSEESPQ